MSSASKGQQNSRAATSPKVAIVVADGFEQVELTTPLKALLADGFAVEIVSPNSGSQVQGFHHQEKADAFPIDVAIGKARPESYVALLLPGGVHNPDALRRNPLVLEFVRHFFAVGKPVAAICHGPWTLIDAQVVSGRRLTSWASIKTDLSNAGAEWVDEAVVCDRGLVTSRGPQDLSAFCKKMLEEFRKEPQGNAHDAAVMSKLSEMIKNIKVAMLTTRQQDGSLHSCPMITQGKQFERTLWFFTAMNSEKCDEVASKSEVNISYADPSTNRYVSVSGRAKLVRDRNKMQELWSPLIKAWFPKGLVDPDLGLLQVTVDHAEYWDTPSGKTVALFHIAKSVLTGRPYQGEGTAHEKIALDTVRNSELVLEANAPFTSAASKAVSAPSSDAEKPLKRAAQASPAEKTKDESLDSIAPEISKSAKMPPKEPNKTSGPRRKTPRKSGTQASA